MRFQGRAVGIDHRQLVVAVGGGAAMARQVLEHRQDAAGQQALGDGAGDGRDLARLGAVGAVADHRVAARDRHVGQRQAVDVDAERAAGRPRSGGRPSRAAARPDGRLAVVELAVAAPGG